MGVVDDGEGVGQLTPRGWLNLKVVRVAPAWHGYPCPKDREEDVLW